MSWISDVKYDLGKLDLSIKSLKKFGFTVGSVFLALFTWFYLADIFIVFRFILLTTGILLISAAAVYAAILSAVYKVWMGSAFVLGWIVSRVILTLLFYFVLTPVALLAKIFGKKFLDAEWGDKSKSYWIKKEESRINYEKMF